MIVAMAINASNIAVLGLIGSKHVICLAVTGTTILGRHIRWIAYIKRHMRRMTGLAILIGHIWRMLAVTSQALIDSAMFHVTVGAGHFSMHTRITGYFHALLLMTGQTGSCNIASQGQIKWRVGIGMTAGAIINRVVMLTARMAHTALGNCLDPGWRVLLMAILTTHSESVLPSLSGYYCRLFGMAPYALFIGNGRYLRTVLSSDHGAVNRAAKMKHQCAKKNNYPFSTQ